MAASGYTWAGKKLTPKELNNSQRSDPLPLVAKVTQVTSEYEKSCPQLTSGTVLWVYGSTEEERVALKTTTDRNPKYISIPLDAPIRFEVVYTHERGPPTFLSSLLKGKVQSELRVEMAGNTGNRLSSTPDQTQSVPYGTLQVVGIYKETVLRTQTITNVSGELNSLRRNLSVNCPISLDVATGLYGKSADEFQKLKTRLRQNQSTGSGNQAETSSDLMLLRNPPKSSEDFNHLQHICQLYSNLHGNTTASSPEIGNGKSATILGQALQQLRQSSKQDNIPLVDKTSSRKSVLLQNAPSAKSSSTPKTDPTYDDGMSNLGKNWIKPNNYVTIDAPKQEPTVYENEFDKRGSSSKSPTDTNVPSVYTNESQPVSSISPDTGVNTLFGLHLQPPATDQPVSGEYANEIRPEQSRNGIQARDGILVNSPSPSDSFHSGSPTVYANDIPVAYEEIPAARNDPGNAAIPSGKQSVPLPPIPTAESLDSSETKPKTKAQIKSLKTLISRKEDGDKRRSDAIPEIDSSDEGEYVEPEEELVWRRSTAEIPRKDSNRKWSTLSDVPKNVKDFSISDVSLCLELLKLEEYVEKFQERNVDGKFLLKLSKSMLMESFRMQEFEARQLFEFAVKKWRPKK